MKKVLIFLASIVASLCGFNIISNASSQEIMPIYSNNELKTCLGKSINVINAKNYGDIANSDVLDFDYYNSLEVCDNKYYKSSNTHYVSGKSVEEVVFNINAEYSHDLNVSGIKYKGFTLGAQRYLSITNDFDYSTYYSRSFVEFVGEVNQGKYYIPNGLTKQDEIKEHLSANFKSSLIKLKNGQMNYDRFFSSFGTHLITSYVYGDRLYLDSYCVSNEKYINNTFAVDFYTNAKASFGSINGSTTASLDFKTSYSLSEDNSKYSCGITCASGKTLAVDSNAITEWVEYVNSNKFNDTIVEYSNDSFVPIWELLPDDSPISAIEMEKEFIKYANYNIKSYDNNCKYNFISKTYSVERLGNYPVNDKDRFTYTEGIVLSSEYCLDVIKKAFDIVVLNISFDARLYDKGYQLFYLYNESDANNKKYSNFLYEYINESGSKTLGLTKEYQHFSFVIEIETSRLTGSTLALVWRAHGNGSDKWVNNNLRINISFK